MFYSLPYSYNGFIYLDCFNVWFKSDDEHQPFTFHDAPNAHDAHDAHDATPSLVRSLFGPLVRSLVPPKCRFDMPDLIEAALHHKRDVIPFPIRESWLDVGRPADFALAQAERVSTRNPGSRPQRAVADA